MAALDLLGWFSTRFTAPAALLAGVVGSASFGTVGEWAASGRFAEGENEPEVARFTSAGCGSALRADEVGGAMGLRPPAPAV